MRGYYNHTPAQYMPSVFSWFTVALHILLCYASASGIICCLVVCIWKCSLESVTKPQT